MYIKLKTGLEFKKINYKNDDWKRKFTVLWKDGDWYAVFPNHYVELRKVDLREYCCINNKSSLKGKDKTNEENVDPQK